MGGHCKRQGWSTARLTGIAALCTASIAVTSDAWIEIANTAWRDQEASHILLVPIVTGWLAWVRRRRLRAIRPEFSYLGALVTMLGGVMYSLGDTYLFESVWQTGAIVALIGCVLTTTGRQLLISFAPAFLSLLFLVPVPGIVRQQIAMPLQTVTAIVSQQLLELFGCDVQRAGNTLAINGTLVQIAEACNGLRMVFALALVSFAFSFGNPLRNGVRLLVLLATPVSAVLCNVVRLVPTVWVYGRHPGAWAVWFHDISAWAMLLVSFLALLGIVRTLRWALFPVARFTLAYD